MVKMLFAREFYINISPKRYEVIYSQAESTVGHVLITSKNTML